MELQNKDIYIRPIHNKDTNSICEILQDVNVSKYLWMPIPYSLKDAKQLVQKNNKNHHIFVVIENKSKTIVGYWAIWYLSLLNYRWEIEYALWKEYWWMWYWKQMIELLLEYAFYHLKLHKVCAHVRTPNIASINLLEKFWFHQEWVLQDNVYDTIDKKWIDHIAYWLINTQYYQKNTSIKNIVDNQWRITQRPSKRNKQTIVLYYICAHLMPNKHYSEKEINRALYNLHTFQDPALLRRELFVQKFINREKDGSSYWVD